MSRLLAGMCVVYAAMLFSGCAVLQQVVTPDAVTIYPVIVPAEDRLPDVLPEAEFADYWIRRMPDPDAVILTPEAIAAFNAANPATGVSVTDVLTLPAELDGAPIRDYLARNARYTVDAAWYVTADIPLEAAERARIAARMDTTRVQDVITPRFGLTLVRTMGRTWPTEVPLMEKPGDNEFDPTVMSSVDMNEPVALLHTSRDGRWCFVRTYGFMCWLPAETVAFGDTTLIRELTGADNPVVALGPRVTVFADPEENAAIGDLSMGGCLSVSAVGNEFFEVLIPARGVANELVIGHGYIRRGSDASLGFPPFTPRAVIERCFAAYGVRYGWGGMGGGVDCSGFVRNVYASFGIRLPRNSGAQVTASTGVLDLTPYDRATRLRILEAAPGGITVAGFSGHVMVYLGTVDGHAYVINAPWAWRTPGLEGGPEVVHRVARVTVSDILLGDGSEKGALIDRLTSMAIIGNYTFTMP